MSFADKVTSGLKSRFRFRSVSGQWMQDGICPDCKEPKVYCAADRPKVVRCGRASCGYEERVRDILPELFEDWSKRAPATDDNPNATADAYLIERCLDLRWLRGTYEQASYTDQKVGTTATIRFPLANDSWWERLIDRPGRFGDKKARFRWIDPAIARDKPDFGRWSGHWWMPNMVDWELLAGAKQIWIAEGIFDCVALNQVGLTAVSVMSISNYPQADLERLLGEIAQHNPKHRPQLVFAYDVGVGGVKAARDHVKRAREEGWIDATAAQVRPDGEGTKKDWNDLLIDHLSYRGTADEAPFSAKRIDDYLWNGAYTVAETPRDKAKMFHERTGLSNFTLRFQNKLYAAKITYEEGDDGKRGQQRTEVEEISNCAFRILYMERDESIDETNFFFQIDFPERQRQTVKARFSSNACASGGEFKKRLMAFAGGWSGTAEQLDRLMRQQTKNIKIVEPIPFTGYSDAHKAWVFGDIAVRDGRLITINSEKYFDFGRAAVKLRTPERILNITYNPDRREFGWIRDIWLGWGERGLVALSFFMMSLFAVQIRKAHESLAFLELTGDAGSGKTTLITFLWKLLGRSGYEGFDPNKGSIAGVARNFIKVSNLPVGLIEGNRDERGAHRRQFDWTELLTLYNGRSPRVTGARTGGTETVEPPFLGAIYLMQNERIDSITAVLERLMSFRFDKEHWTDASPAAAERIEALQVEDVSDTIIHIVRAEKLFLDTFFTQYRFHRDQMKGRKPGLSNARCIKNHAQLAAALEATAAVLPLDRQTNDEAVARTIQFIDAMALDRQQSAGSDHPLVVEFWEKVDFILSAEQRADGFDPQNSLNRSRRPDELFAINLPAFDQRCRNYNLTPMRMDELKRVLRGSRRRKFVDAKTVNGRDGRASTCWVFENPGAPRSTENI